MKILICSILRNNEPMMETFISQIHRFVDKLSDVHDFSISLYENDSEDNTAKLMNKIDKSRFIKCSIVSEKLGLPRFGSVVAEERIKNIAIARNKALLAKNMYLAADYVLFIDCDVIYDDDFIPTLLDFKSIGITPDVYSGVSIVQRLPDEQNIQTEMYIFAKPNGLPNKSDVYRVYDTWGTRRYINEEWGTWFQSAKDLPINQVWATYNSICLYNAKPFKDGIRFNHINERLNKFDLEVAVVCEHFRNAGYNSIWINQSLFCLHS